MSATTHGFHKDRNDNSIYSNSADIFYCSINVILNRAALIANLLPTKHWGDAISLQVIQIIVGTAYYSWITGIKFQKGVKQLQQ